MLKFATFGVTAAVQVPTGASRRTLRAIAKRHEFDFEPRPGYLYVRSRAISSRTNDNYDEFPAAEIEKAYQTFVGKPVFVNHVNDNHRRKRGVCIDAVLHKDALSDGSPDTWCEVLMEIDAITFPMLAKAILEKRIDRTSMGCDVEHSICSACGNKASTPAEYCSHIPKRKGALIVQRSAKTGKPEQHLIRETCYGLKFFENSVLVEEPADPTAHTWGVELGDDLLANRHVSPRAASLDGHDDRLRHSVASRDLVGGHLPSVSASRSNQWQQVALDDQHVGLGQTSSRVAGARQAATSIDHVLGVLPVGAQDPVSGVVAQRRVASVTDHFAGRDGSDQPLVAPSVRAHAAASRVVEGQTAVSVLEGASGPEPAVVRTSSGHLALVSLQDCHGQQASTPTPSAHFSVLQHFSAETKHETPSVSGVALKAMDTGRVLMLQRSVKDEKDPARGTWEFPGGHHEDGDASSLHAGIREWEEEVGQKFPEGGTVSHVWRSPNGIYQGHVVTIPEESQVALHEGRVKVNPDDPDGDDSEQAAWWDPKHAEKNPALRKELKTAPWEQVRKAAAAKSVLRDDVPVDGYDPEEMGPEDPQAKFHLERLDLSRVKHLEPMTGQEHDRGSSINDGYYSAMHNNLSNAGPLVATEHPDGEIELHDGWHRGSMALANGQTHYPAYIHRPSEAGEPKTAAWGDMPSRERRAPQSGQDYVWPITVLTHDRVTGEPQGFFRSTAKHSGSDEQAPRKDWPLRLCEDHLAVLHSQVDDHNQNATEHPQTLEVVPGTHSLDPHHYADRPTCDSCVSEAKAARSGAQVEAARHHHKRHHHHKHKASHPHYVPGSGWRGGWGAMGMFGGQQGYCCPNDSCAGVDTVEGAGAAAGGDSGGDAGGGDGGGGMGAAASLTKTADDDHCPHCGGDGNNRVIGTDPILLRSIHACADCGKAFVGLGGDDEHALAGQGLSHTWRTAAQGLVRHEVAAQDVAEGDCLDSTGKTRVHKTLTRNGTTTLAWRVRGSKAPGIHRHDADAQVKVWRREGPVKESLSKEATEYVRMIPLHKMLDMHSGDTPGETGKVRDLLPALRQTPHYHEVAKSLDESGAIQQPLFASEFARPHPVMDDGHHRMAWAEERGLSHVPVDVGWLGTDWADHHQSPEQFHAPKTSVLSSLFRHFQETS